MKLQSARGLDITYEPAGVGHRIAAYLIDASVLGLVWLFLLTLAAMTAHLWRESDWFSDWVVVLAIILIGFLHLGYWFIQEGFQNGQSLGKRSVGLRVMDVSGRPLAPWQAAVRTLLRTVDFLPVFYGVGMLCLALGEKPRRLGDWAAGTVVVLERVVDLSVYDQKARGESAGESEEAEAFVWERFHVTEEHRAMIAEFLSRKDRLDAPARERLAEALVEPFHQQVDEENLRAYGFDRPEALLQAVMEASQRRS